MRALLFTICVVLVDGEAFDPAPFKNAGENPCPEGFTEIHDDDTCIKAVGFLQIHPCNECYANDWKRCFTKLPATNQYTNSHYPPGCFYSAWEGDGCALYMNLGGNETAKPDSGGWDRLCQAQPNPTPFKNAGENPCPEGFTEIHDDDTCIKAVEFLQIHPCNECYANDWKRCFTKLPATIQYTNSHYPPGCFYRAWEGDGCALYMNLGGNETAKPDSAGWDRLCQPKVETTLLI